MPELKAFLYQMIEGRIIETIALPVEDCVAAFEVRGFAFHHLQEQYKGGIQLRECLVGAPVFSGVLGPMYDGPGRLRYEDSATHAHMSE